MGLLNTLGLPALRQEPSVPPSEPEVASGAPRAAGDGPKAPAAKKAPKARTAKELREMARWPGEAHRAWKGLGSADRKTVLEAMGKAYGTAFAQSFEKATTGSKRLVAHGYVTSLPHQTPTWFANNGYKLADRATYQQWWVHPDGHEIYLVLESTPKELKDALEAVQRALGKAEVDYSAVTLLGLSLDKFFPVPSYPSDPVAVFEDYVAKLDLLNRFVDDAMAKAAKARAGLLKKGIAVSDFDAQVAQLHEIRWRVKNMLSDEQLDERDPYHGDTDDE